MQLARPAFAIDPRRFGRGRAVALAARAPKPAFASISDDAKLFATTFVAGFVFVSLFLA